MAFLVLDIETIPRPTIDESIEEVIAQKTQARVERTGDDPENAESLIRSTSPFFGQVLCIGLRWLQDDGTSKDKVIYKLRGKGQGERSKEAGDRSLTRCHP